MTDAAALALADPDNPYTAMRKVLDSQADQLAEAEDNAATITRRLAELDLKGGWSVPKAVRKRERIRALAAPPANQDQSELLFLRTSSGEIVQVVPADDMDVPARATDLEATSCDSGAPAARPPD